MSIGKRLLYMFSIDFLVSIAVIAVVVGLFGYQAQKTRTLILGVAATTGALEDMRIPILTYYAIHGEWPTDREALRSYVAGRWKRYTTQTDEVLVGNGALTFRALKGPAANMLTIHPAVPLGDPLGPVIWVAGSHSRTESWAVIGEDHTTLAENKILHALK
jgi:hypothetical protein